MPPSRRQSRVLVTIALGVVLATSLLPVSAAGGLPAGADKLLHAAGYAVLALLGARALPAKAWGDLAVVALAAAGLGVAVELVQPLVGRNASVLDGAANALGAAFGVAYGSLSSRFSKY